MMPGLLITSPLFPGFPAASAKLAVSPDAAPPDAWFVPHTVNPNNARAAAIQSVLSYISHHAWDAPVLARVFHHAAIVCGPAVH